MQLRSKQGELFLDPSKLLPADRAVPVPISAINAQIIHDKALSLSRFPLNHLKKKLRNNTFPTSGYMIPHLKEGKPSGG
jgi:hypothetical protein